METIAVGVLVVSCVIIANLFYVKICSIAESAERSARALEEIQAKAWRRE